MLNICKLSLLIIIQIVVFGHFVKAGNVSIELVSPANNAKGTTIIASKFICKYNSTTELSSISFYNDFSGNWELDESSLITGTSGTSTFSRVLPEGLYNWGCSVCDIDNDCMSSNNNTINVTHWPKIVEASPCNENFSPQATAITMRLKLDKSSICNYDSVPGKSRGDMEFSFDNAYSTTIIKQLYGLESGQNYTYYIKCREGYNGYTTPDDYEVTFYIKDDLIPQIDNIEINGGMISIDGSSFKTKENAEPLLWDDFENGVSGDLLANHSSYWHGYSGGNGAEFSNSNSYSGNLSSFNHINQSNNHGFKTNYFTFDGSEEVYISYQFRIEGTGNKAGVLKLSRITSDYSGEVSSVPHYNGPGDTGIGTSASDVTNYLSMAHFNNGDFPVHNKRIGFGLAPDVWQRYSTYKKLSTPGNNDGEIFYTRNNKVGWREYLLTRTQGFNFQLNSVTLGLMVANVRDDGNFYLNIDDIYIDNTLARVEVCDESSWRYIEEHGAHCEIQIPQTWNDTTVDINVNRGIFQAGESAYLYVVDEDGAVNENGYHFVFGDNSLDVQFDANQDFQINTTDAMLTLRNSLGLDMANTNWQTSATTGDVNCDGNSNSTDAMLLLRYSLGLDMGSTDWCD